MAKAKSKAPKTKTKAKTKKPKPKATATAKKPKPKPKQPKPKPARDAMLAPISFAVVEVDPASFPDDIKAHALALAPLVRELRELAATRPKAVRVGPPTTRDRVVALGQHYGSTLLPDYTALVMLADGIFVEDSYELYDISTLMSAKLEKRTEKLRAGYSECLPIGKFSLSDGWLYVMPTWGEPYCENVMGTKVQRKQIIETLTEMLKAARG